MRTTTSSNVQTIFASAARTATANSGALENATRKGGIFTLNVSAASGTTPTLVVKIQGYDDLSASWYDVAGLAFAQQTAVSTAPLPLTVYPGVTVAANAGVSTLLPRRFRAVATIGGTSPSFTFSLNVVLVP